MKLHPEYLIGRMSLADVEAYLAAPDHSTTSDDAFSTAEAPTRPVGMIVVPAIASLID